MSLRNALGAALVLGLLAACTLPHTDLTSPCAGADGSPCARHPVNDWWLNSPGHGEDS
jgi:hypothetical protein